MGNEALIFRVIPDTTPKHAGLFQIEAKRPGGRWHLVSDALEAREVDAQMENAKRAGMRFDDLRPKEK